VNNVEKVAGVVLFFSETMYPKDLDNKQVAYITTVAETDIIAEHKWPSSDGKTEPVSLAMINNDPPCKVHSSAAAAAAD
jgi:hypothetical protein